MSHEYLSPLLASNETKIILLVLDGLGGLPAAPGGPTELEAAKTPLLDRLASEGAVGRTIPVAHGVTPGSGPAHLSLFGYHPLKYDVGRGVLEAAGVGLQIAKGDIAARGNFCTLTSEGYISDRRAGRISNEDAQPAIRKLQSIQVPDVNIEVRHVKEYRFAVVMRGEGLVPDLPDTDPQIVGKPPLKVEALSPAAERAAEKFRAFVEEAQRVLADEPRANGITLRGFDTDPQLPGFGELYGLDAACVAVYPMYRGVASLAGMRVLSFEGEQPEDEFKAVVQAWKDYNFFFVHIKKTDSMGEDGNFQGKVEIIEKVDRALPALLDLKPDVFIVTGDHSTPAALKSHSWHPVPFLLWAPESHLPDTQDRFGERACSLGGLGTFHATETLPLALAHAKRLRKFGA